MATSQLIGIITYHVVPLAEILQFSKDSSIYAIRDRPILIGCRNLDQ